MSDIEFGPIDEVQLGAVGEPGLRTFLIQARQGKSLVTLIMEKGQVATLGEASYQLLVQIGQLHMTQELLRAQSEGEEIPTPTFQEDDPLWRVAGFDLIYEEERNLAIIEFEELVDEDEEPSVLRMLISPVQLGAMALEGLSAVAQGRPICPLCHLVIQDQGHVCPATNGYHPAMVDN